MPSLSDIYQALTLWALGRQRRAGDSCCSQLSLEHLRPPAPHSNLGA